MTKTYRVAWYIDVDAESHIDAAQIARGIQLDPDSIATFFTVADDESAIAIDVETGETYPA